MLKSCNGYVELVGNLLINCVYVSKELRHAVHKRLFMSCFIDIIGWGLEENE